MSSVIYNPSFILYRGGAPSVDYDTGWIEEAKKLVALCDRGRICKLDGWKRAGMRRIKSYFAGKNASGKCPHDEVHRDSQKSVEKEMTSTDVQIIH